MDSTSQGGLKPPVCGGMPWCGGMQVVHPLGIHYFFMVAWVLPILLQSFVLQDLPIRLFLETFFISLI